MSSIAEIALVGCPWLVTLPLAGVVVMAWVFAWWEGRSDG